MASLMLLLSLFAVDVLSILSPGPNILLVTQTAVEHSRRQALVVGLGLMSGSLLWACIALTGLSALFNILPSLQTAIRIAGAAYLIHLGIKLLRSRGAMRHAPRLSTAGLDHKAFLQGFATSLLNPKVLAYFSSIFILFVPADASIWFRAAAVSIILVDAVFCYGIVALLLSMPVVQRGYVALRRPIDRACGALMLAFGVRLILGTR